MQVLDAVQPHVVHVHSLLNLSFDLPAVARARGVPVVATLHDYSLVCPSGGQRVHRADAHLVVDRPRGNRRVYELNPGGVEALRAYFDRFWNHALDSFKRAAETKEER